MQQRKRLAAAGLIRVDRASGDGVGVGVLFFLLFSLVNGVPSADGTGPRREKKCSAFPKK